MVGNGTIPLRSYSYRGFPGPPLFLDRTDAGRQLALLLSRYREAKPFVLALPRGGVPVAYQIARALDAPLDVLPVRKLGAPGRRELGVGAVAAGGAFVLDVAAIRALGFSREQIEEVAREEAAELERRTRQFRGDRPMADLRGRTVILVDDGLATGMTARAAIRAVRQMGPATVVLAAPVCAPEAAAELRPEVDDLVCLALPPRFLAVGYWYRNFDQTSDDEVLDLLARARRPDGSTGPSDVEVAQ